MIAEPWVQTKKYEKLSDLIIFIFLLERLVWTSLSPILLFFPRLGSGILKLDGRNKTLDIIGIALYLRKSLVFVPLLSLISNQWMKKDNIPQSFTRVVIKLLRIDKNGGDGISNFQPLIMLKTVLMIWVKVLANRLVW